VVGYIENVIVPIHIKRLLLTLTLAIHVPIVIRMGMMQIIASCCIQSFNKANYEWPMLVKVRGLGKAKNDNVWSTKGWPPKQLQINPTPWRQNFHS